MLSVNFTQEIESLAHNAGFDLFGVCAAEPFEQERARLLQWLEKGYAGEMLYLHNNVEKRLDPRKVMPSAKSIICLGISYYYGESLLSARKIGDTIPIQNTELGHVPNFPARNDQGLIARYAWGKDYHKVLKKKLLALKKQIVELTGPETELKEYTDTGPILERQAAARAGLGFIGKNTLLLNSKHGSYFFLAELLTNLELDYGDPVATHCGSCRACIDACPTQAFPKPYELDATRCISYWTIESRSEIPAEFHAPIGKHAFGCDICQEVCPFNRHPLASSCEEFAPAQGAGPALDIEAVLRMDETSFHEGFSHTPLTRAKYSGIIRNTRIVQKNFQKNLCSPAS